MLRREDGTLVATLTPGWPDGAARIILLSAPEGAPVLDSTTMALTVEQKDHRKTGRTLKTAAWLQRSRWS